MDRDQTSHDSDPEGFETDSARFLKVLGNASRLRILDALREEPLQVGDLEERLGLGQPYVSQQLARLRAAGIVAGERRGRAVRYRVVDGRVASVLETLHRFQTARQTGGVGKL